MLARNWRCPDGEIDVIVGLGSTVVFCEVKARSTNAFGSGAEAVTISKRRRLRRLAAAWLAQHDRCWADVRFDVAVVTSGKLEMIESAF